jgi:hypothetical protein
VLWYSSLLIYQLLDEHAMLELLVGVAVRIEAEEVDELGIEQEGVATVQRHL